MYRPATPAGSAVHTARQHAEFVWAKPSVLPNTLGPAEGKRVSLFQPIKGDKLCWTLHPIGSFRRTLSQRVFKLNILNFVLDDTALLDLSTFCEKKRPYTHFLPNIFHCYNKFHQLRFQSVISLKTIPFALGIRRLFRVRQGLAVGLAACEDLSGGTNHA
jgi:hypothetical protein